jgi:hypothetical protein
MNGIRTENYDIKIDVKKGLDGKIISGLEIGDIMRQNQALIMVMHKGELKENPSVGVGISDIINDHQLDKWRAEIREQLEMDGQKVDSVKLDNYGLTIEAEY